MMRMGTIIALVSACAVAMAVIWLVFGDRLLLVIDRIFPGRPFPKPIKELLLRSDAFALGDRGWPPPESGAFMLSLDSTNRLVLRVDRRTFTFGPVKTRWADPVKPQYLFIPESDDVVSFTRDVSRLSWQTPFAISFMGGPKPKWHRHAYDRLRWTKKSGTTLEVMWRDEQVAYSRSSDWFDQWNNRLKHIEIHFGPVENAAAVYLLATRKWTGNEYRLEPQTSTPAGDLVTAVYLDDERAQQPGAGKSVKLRIDKSSMKVVGETGFQ